KLYTIHEQWLLCPSHVLWRNNHVCEARPCLSCEIRHGRPPQPWRHTGMLERSLRHLDVLIAPSRSAAALHGRVARPVPIPAPPQLVPPPPAATPAGVPAAPRPARPYFLYAGRLEPIKGVSNLIEAFRRRRSEDLVIAGGGALERRLRSQSADLAHVRFTGHL